MKLISNRALREFSERHADAQAPLQEWRRVIEKNTFRNWGELKRAFNTVDKVGDLCVFNIGGNKYRLIAHVRLERQIVYVEDVLTHKQYDQGEWK